MYFNWKINFIVMSYNTIPALDPMKVKLKPLVVNVSGLNRGEDEEEELESVAV